jgi:WD40 repeat protein
METNPYHVRLSISQYGDRYKAELFTEDLGDTEGEFLPADWEAMEQWLTFLSQGAADLPSDSARSVGKELFAFLMRGTENSKKWAEILERVGRQKRPLRLLIDASTEHVRDLPYGLLCEPHDDYFLFRSASESHRPPIQFVRILRRCTPKLLNLTRSPLKILIVAAEPISENLSGFACAQRLRELSLALFSSFEVYALSHDGPELLNSLPTETDNTADCTYKRFCFARPEVVKSALAAPHTFDILHIMGHGLGGELVLCDDSKHEVSVTPGELGEWCSATELQMAFLQVCEGARTSNRGGFGGLAQQLINPKYGNLATVIASSYPLDANGSTSAAIRFYDGIAKGQSPDIALQRNLDEQNWSWALLELWVRPSALGGVTNRGAFQFLSPYRGLARFEERNSDIFFGRNAETAELIQMIEDDSILTLVGDTGSGKSSLLQAGIASVVRQKGLLGRSGWEIVTVEPGGSLRERLIAALRANLEIIEGECSHDLLKLLNLKCEEGRSLLLIIDQFEEVFTLKESEVELHQLCDILAYFAAQHPNSFRLVLGLRTEYLAAAITLRGVSKAISRPLVLSPPVSSDLVNIILEPARQYGYTFEEIQTRPDSKDSSGLLERILSDPILTRFTGQNAQTESTASVNPLPLLEFALERLWLMSVRRGSQEFKHEDYENLGGLGGAIISHAEDVFSKLPSVLGLAAQAVCKDIFIALVSSSGTRRPRTRAELEASTKEKQLTNEVINYLVGERLLAIRSNPDKLDLNYVDLIHEVLIERWARFKSWLAENPSLRALIESFEADASKWLKWSSNSTSAARIALPSPAQAKQYLLWIDATKPSLPPEHRQFVLNLRRMLWRRKATKSVLALATIAGLIVAAFLILKVRNQQHETRLNLARNLQQKAVVAIHNNEMLDAEVYSTQALTVEDDPEQQRQIRELLLDARARGAKLESRREFEGRLLYANWEEGLILTSSERVLYLYRFTHRPGSTIQMQEISTFMVGDDNIKYAAISTGGRWLAYGTRNGILKILNISTKELSFQDHFQPGKEEDPPISSLVFNSKGQRVAYSSESGPIRIYDLITRRTNTLFGHEQPVHKMAFSQDSSLLVSASSDDTVRVWDLSRDGIQKIQMRGHSDVISSVAISLDKERIASGSADGTVRIWDTSKEAAINVLQGSAGDFVTLSFSPDRRILAAGAEDKTIRLFDLIANKEVLKINSFDGEAKYLSFDSQSQRLFVACERAISIWTVVKDLEVRTLIDNGKSLSSVAFSPDGEFLAAASHDSYIHIWDFKKKHPVASLKAADHGRINSVAFSPDGKMLAAAAEELGTTDLPLKLWEVKNNSYHRVSLTDSNGCITGRGIQGVTFSPSQPILATSGGYNTNIGLWDLRTMKCSQVVIHPNDKCVWDVAFSPDGQYLASVGDDRNVSFGKFSDVAAGGKLSKLYEHTQGVWGVGFSPVQPLLASASVDRFVKVWNLETNVEFRFPEKDDTTHTAGIVDVTFDPRGVWLASASENNLVTLWNLATRKSLALKLHAGPVWSVSFSNDGKWLASCALDGRIQVWDMDRINSIYSSSPLKLLEESQKDTGLAFDDRTQAIVLLR